MDVEREIRKREVTLSLFALGIERFIVGLAKKVIFANTLAYVADQVFSFPETQLGTPLAWLGILCYTFQIYFDFSGYSDMAIGLGRMLGFHFLENFNYPYISKSIKEFWRRWHISLSTWFRDYLYIPLGGNRVSVSRTYVNLLIVFFLTGLWHGASWNFILWGLFHGSFLVLERLGFDKVLERSWRPLQHLYTLLVVVIGWVFFRADRLDQAMGFLSKLFIYQNNVASDSHLAMLLNHEVWLILALAALFSTPIMARLSDWTKSKTVDGQSSLRCVSYDLVLMGLFLVSCLYLAVGTYNPFIYFRF
jgi:alginate O-acetyltransferase complex protein AlgI